MTRLAVLLRGVNVGGRRRLPMAELRALATRLGYTNPATHLQSGNLVVSTDVEPARVEAELTAALDAEFGLDVPCLARTGAELRALVTGTSLVDRADQGAHLVAHVLSAHPDSAVTSAHDVRELAPGRIEVGDRVVYQWCPDGTRQAPPVGPYVERRWGVLVTSRNWNTVTRMAELTG